MVLWKLKLKSITIIYSKIFGYKINIVDRLYSINELSAIIIWNLKVIRIEKLKIFLFKKKR